MVKTLYTLARGVTAVGTTTAGSTQYWCVANGPFVPAAENQREITSRTAGTYSKLYVRVITNTASASSSVTFRKNQAGTAMTLSIPAATTGEFEDTTNEVSVVAGDEVAFESVSGGTGTITFSLISVIFDSDTNSNAVSRLGPEGQTMATASTTFFHAITGDRTTGATTEANMETTLKKAGTAKNAFFFINTNGRSTDTVLTLRKNGTNTAITTTVAAGVSGIVEDTTHTVSYAIDDEICWAFTLGTGTGNFQLTTIALEYENTSREGLILAGAISAHEGQNVNLTRYFPVGGAHLIDTTEANNQIKARHAFTISGLSIKLIANTVTAASSFTLRKNAADTALVVSITASTTGVFSNTANSVTFTDSDQISLELTTGATGTTVTIQDYSLFVKVTSLAVTKNPIETTTISESAFSRLKSALRTLAAQTTTISESFDNLIGKIRALGAQTVTIAENVTGQRIPGGGTAINKTISDTITVGETRARLKAVWRQQP